MDHDRLRFVFGEDVLDQLDVYDLDDEGIRTRLVEEYAGLPFGEPGREAAMACRTVIINQILDGDPPEVWATAQRLSEQGIARESVLSQLSIAINEHLSKAVTSKEPFDLDAYAQDLDRLPFPERSEIARSLIEAARAEPGIDADDHFDAVLTAHKPSRGQALDGMVDRVLDELVQREILHWLPGDKTVVVPDLVAAAAFTHRFNSSEAELAVLTVGLDLGAFSCFDVVRLDDGSELDQISAQEGHLVWRGPTGWLAGFEPGDLLACTVRVEGGDDALDETTAAIVTIEVLADEPQVSDGAVEAVRAGYEELMASGNLPVAGGELAWWLLFNHPGLFDTAKPPVSELCAAAGLEQRGGLVADDEAVWRNHLHRRRYLAVCEMVPESQWRLVLGRALEVLDDPDAAADDVRGVLDECAEPEAIDVLADVLFDHYLDGFGKEEHVGADSPERLFELVHRATSAARRPRETATARYLAAVLQERCGAPDLAEQHLKRAAEAQPRLGPVVERLGWYRFDRGDASGALRWWRTLTEVPDVARVLEPFLAPDSGERKPGRNEPCWCGSGRKFKHCHRNTSDLPPLPDRVGWLWRKASTWLDHTTGDVRSTLVEVATARATGDPDAEPWNFASLDDDEMFEMFGAAFADPITYDAALNEGGLFGLFLHERGPLLPQDEQLLAASWRSIDRSVHEVVTVEPGAKMTLRDLATGEMAEVRERSGSTEAEVGQRYCARVVPDGASHRVIGGVFPVRTGHEAAVLDLCATGDPLALCAWVGRLGRPPRLVHQPGLADEMFDHDAIEALLADFDEDGDPEAAMAALNAELVRQAQARWLDEEIPALDGLTPREAAADPTRREQLERLLTEFETIDQRTRDQPGELPDGFTGFSYDVDELRRSLGLD